MIHRLSIAQRIASSCLLAFTLATAAGCATTRTLVAVNPRPSVVVDADMGKMALDLGAVPDNQTPGEGLNVTEYRKTLSAGFHNMVGGNFTDDAKDAKLVLHIEQSELSRGNIGELGGFIIIRYRARWTDGDGGKIAALAGVAQPRNPTEPGPRHLEDVVEVMYEGMVEGLEKAQGVKVR